MKADVSVKILIVDDLEENLIALEALLRSDELQIIRARSGREALEMLLVHDFALALLDVQMPEMDGFELAEFMRGSERTRHIPIIFVTAGASDRNRVFQGYEAGAVDFLEKPLEVHVIRGKVGTFVELYRQRWKLSETLRLNEMFMAVLGHDLRNPLGVVTTSAHLLSKHPDQKVRDFARRLEVNAGRMARMITQLLDLARSRLGSGIPLKREQCDLKPIIHRIVDELRMLNPNRIIHLEIESDLVGIFDEDRLSQLLSNLLGNAITHGSKEAPIVVRAQMSPEQLMIEVCNGGSIPPELLPHLFDPFRSGARSAQKGGLGLGLYIAHQIAVAHHGTIEVESKEGVISFTVRVSRKKSMAEEGWDVPPSVRIPTTICERTGPLSD